MTWNKLQSKKEVVKRGKSDGHLFYIVPLSFGIDGFDKSVEWGT